MHKDINTPDRYYKSGGYDWHPTLQDALQKLLDAYTNKKYIDCPLCIAVGKIEPSDNPSRGCNLCPWYRVHGQGSCVDYIAVRNYSGTNNITLSNHYDQLRLDRIHQIKQWMKKWEEQNGRRVR